MAFPDGFWWGTAASSGDRGFATRYADDFALYAEHGLTHHRLTLPWSRLEPRRGAPDGGAVEHYRSVLEAGRAAGLSVWACLERASLPGWFTDDEGGLVDDRARTGIWQRHVAWVAETFGDLVAGWMPLAFDPAGDPKRLEAHHLAHRDAWRELRGGGPPVATVHRLAPIYRLGTSDLAYESTRTMEQAVWGAPIRAMRDGILAVPGLAEVEVPDLQGSADLFGFAYFGAAGVVDDGSTVPYPAGARVGPTGEAPWPEGLGIVLHRLDEELPGTPLLIAEHGVGTDDDRWRTDMLRASLGQVEEALGDGVDVRGFFHWTGVDAGPVPFGLFDGDRQAKPSAELLASYASAGRPEGRER